MIKIYIKISQMNIMNIMNIMKNPNIHVICKSEVNVRIQMRTEMKTSNEAKMTSTEHSGTMAGEQYSPIAHTKWRVKSSCEGF